MKIALVHNSYRDAGGEDVVVAQERRCLEQRGHTVVLYHRSNCDIDDSAPLERLALAARTVWSRGTRREFAALLSRETPDLVHVHNTFAVISPSIYSVCREYGVPVVQTLHNFRLMCPSATFYRNGETCEACANEGLWQGVRHRCYRNSRSATATVALMLATHRFLKTWDESVDTYIALSAFSRGKFVAAGMNADKFAVKPNFVDPDPGARTEVGDYALFVGRLSEEKGLAVLLSAWERLAEPCPLQIVGDGPLRAVLEARVAMQGIPGTAFRGRLPRPETIALIKGARFLVVPSVCYENFPMAVVEAMSCGTPVLCSRRGAMEEIVADHVYGLHFTPGDPDDLAKKVEWACGHPGELSQMGQAARREYERRYTAESNYSTLMKIYERTINRSPSEVCN